MNAEIGMMFFALIVFSIVASNRASGENEKRMPSSAEADSFIRDFFKDKNTEEPAEGALDENRRKMPSSAEADSFIKDFFKDENAKEPAGGASEEKLKETIQDNASSKLAHSGMYEEDLSKENESHDSASNRELAEHLRKMNYDIPKLVRDMLKSEGVEEP